MKVDDRNKTVFRSDVCFDFDLDRGQTEELVSSWEIPVTMVVTLDRENLEIELGMLELWRFPKMTIDFGKISQLDSPNMAVRVHAYETLNDAALVQILGEVPYDSHSQQFVYRDSDLLSLVVHYWLVNGWTSHTVVLSATQLRPFIDCRR